MLNSLMGETVRPLPLACKWEEIPESFKVNIYPTLEITNVLHYMMIVMETGAHSREVRRISRAIRLATAFNRKLKASVVSSFLSFAPTPGSEAHSRLVAYLPKDVLVSCGPNLSNPLPSEGSRGSAPCRVKGQSRLLGSTVYLVLQVFPALTDRERIKSCLSELGEMSNGSKKAVVAGLEQLVDTMTHRIRPVLDNVPSVSYELLEKEYAENKVNDPWVQRLVHAVESNSGWLQPLPPTTTTHFSI
ncbi:hypothetical protein Tco_1337756 [Tanacetum coccineum]